MPLKETSNVEQRKEWIDAYMAHEPASARRGGGFGISRKTGYRCIAHFLGGCALAGPIATAHTQSARRGHGDRGRDRVRIAKAPDRNATHRAPRAQKDDTALHEGRSLIAHPITGQLFVAHVLERTIGGSVSARAPSRAAPGGRHSKRGIRGEEPVSALLQPSTDGEPRMTCH